MTARTGAEKNGEETNEKEGSNGRERPSAWTSCMDAGRDAVSLPRQTRLFWV